VEERDLLAARPENEPAAGNLFRSACFHCARIAFNCTQFGDEKMAAAAWLERFAG
jgi:hypothetical protein